MRYFGVPTCPYCKKRVNLIRTWSLKRQGEYQCPRCGGISNIFLSPLVYVLALLAVFAGGAMYFFHKFVLDDITLGTAVYVFIPFAAFFLFSLFMVYLEKPVIKKVSKEEYEKKRRIRSAVEGSAGAVPRTDARRGYYEDDDYISRGSNRFGPEGPAPEPQHQSVVNQAAFSRAKRQAAVENTQQSQRLAYPGPAVPQQPVSQVPRTASQPGQVRRPVQPQAQPQQQRGVRQAPAAGQGTVRPQQAQARVRQPRAVSQRAAQQPQQPGNAVLQNYAAQQQVRPHHQAVNQVGHAPQTGQRRPQGADADARRDIR